jgi:hypothetical protein
LAALIRVEDFRLAMFRQELWRKMGDGGLRRAAY